MLADDPHERATMPIVVVGGSGRNVGKTSLICGIIASLPEFPWVAVKVTSDIHGSFEALWEEDRTALSSDTARFRTFGARRAFLFSGGEDDWRISLLNLKERVGESASIIFESNRIVNLVRPDVYLAVRDLEGQEAKPSFQSLAHLTDATVVQGKEDEFIPAPKPAFKLADLTRVSPELRQWLREKLAKTE
jgi:hypothetical protein